jgi:AmmeMemoRadiSam system protein B
LAEAVDKLIAGVGSIDATATTPIQSLRALVVPHAGYGYSGPIAASAYARLAALDRRIERIVLLGPAHWAGVNPLAMPSVDAFVTPLGLVPIDTEGRDLVLQHDGVVLDDTAHVKEHSLEVQLPFLQRVLGTDWSLVPMAAGRGASPGVVADVLELFWDDPSTFVIVSTDLTHYLDQKNAERVDRETAQAILGLEVDAITPDRACGAFALAGLLEAARRHGFTFEQLDLRTSADTLGDAKRVVGYGAFAVVG